MQCTQHRSGGGSNTWGAYITKSDTAVQQETMSRERRKKKTGETTLKYKARTDTPLGWREGGRKSEYIGYTGYTSSLSNNGWGGRQRQRKTS